MTNPHIEIKTTGVRVQLLLNGVNGNRQPVTTGWQYDTDTKEPRLLTIYVDENKRR